MTECLLGNIPSEFIIQQERERRSQHLGIDSSENSVHIVSVFVIETRWVVDTFRDLVALCNNQSTRACNIDRYAASIGIIQRGDNHLGVVDQRGFETAGTSSGFLVVGWNACTTSLFATWPCKLLGDHEVDRNTGDIDPGARLSVRGWEETRFPHGRLDSRDLGKTTRIRGDIAVFRHLRESDINSARSQVDRLCTNDNDRVALLG